MSRVKRGVASHKRHKRVLAQTKGFKAGRARIFSLAKQAVLKSGSNAYRDRRLKKRTFRQLWNARISAALKPHEVNYSSFIGTLFKKKVVVNRKMMSEMAFHYPEAFDSLVKTAK